jgi:hypothetical protein
MGLNSRQEKASDEAHEVGLVCAKVSLGKGEEMT